MTLLTNPLDLPAEALAAIAPGDGFIATMADIAGLMLSAVGAWSTSPFDPSVAGYRDAVLARARQAQADINDAGGRADLVAALVEEADRDIAWLTDDYDLTNVAGTPGRWRAAGWV